MHWSMVRGLLSVQLVPFTKGVPGRQVPLRGEQVPGLLQALMAGHVTFAQRLTERHDPEIHWSKVAGLKSVQNEPLFSGAYEHVPKKHVALARHCAGAAHVVFTQGSYE